MTNLYLNENLVLDSSKKYVIDSNFLTDVSYYVKKEFIIERYDEAIEKRRAGEINNLGEESIKYHVEIFKKNFSRAFRVPMNILNQRIQEYAYEMLSYLDRTFPYCLFENGDVHTKDLDSSLFFFAKNNLLAQEDQLDLIIPVLKTCLMNNLDCSQKYVSESYDYVSYLDINGTSDDKYKRNNLYETLHAFDEEKLIKLLNSILALDGLYNPENIIKRDEIELIGYGMHFCVGTGTEKMILLRSLAEITWTITRNCFDNNPMFRNKVYKIK